MSEAEQKHRALLIEDESLVAIMIEDMLMDLGWEVMDTAARLEDALLAAKTESFDIAILDVNLDGEPSYPIADVLKARGIPFIFATGYGEMGRDARYAGVPTLQKPFLQADLETAVSKALRSAAI